MAADASNAVIEVHSKVLPPYSILVTTDSSGVQGTLMAGDGGKFLYTQVETIFNKAYNPMTSNNSTICDIIAVYIKGQKILYTEAKTHCEQKLTFLMLPAIFITVVCSVLGLVLDTGSYGPTITSSLNGVNAFILALINYLKLDTRAEAHRTSAYKFDKLQSSMEFTSGKVLFINSAATEIVKIIEEIEKKVQEIKETNQFVLPETIRHSYPNLCGINVFAQVKKIQNEDMLNMNKLKDYYNERAGIQGRLRLGDDPSVKKELATVEENIKTQTNLLITSKDKYLTIDKVFEDEMTENRVRMHRCCDLCGCFKV
jgi:hypothetical protein